MSVSIGIIKVEKPEGMNVIVGQSHFIKTVEDLHEIVSSYVPSAKFGISFVESSGACLVRVSGNDETLSNLAARNAMSCGAGHTFFIFLQGAFPITVLNQVKTAQEVCCIFCATANPVELLVASSEQGKGIIGVIDGFSPSRMEGEKDKKARKELLRQLGYKL